MQLSTTLTSDAVYRIANGVADAHYGGNLTIDLDIIRVNRAGRSTFRVKLGAADSRARGARRSASGRRGPYSCWHMFRDVMAAWLLADNDAQIRTGMAVYRGGKGFLADFPQTGNVSVGSAYMPELCDCEHDGAPAEPPYIGQLERAVYGHN